MAEIIENQEDEYEILRKVKSKKRVRGLLIGINVLLACYFIVEATMKIASLVKSSNDVSDFVTLYGYTKEESIKLYDQYLLKNNDQYETKDVYDYGFYGNYLHLSETKIEPGCYTSLSSVYPRRIKDKMDKVDVSFTSNNNYELNKSYLNGGFDLTTLSEGDYILFDDFILENNYSSLHKGVKYLSEEGINHTLYSLAGSNSYRKKINVRSKNSSPCLVISVSNVTTLPNDYYDFVVIGNNAEEYKKAYSNYKIYAASTIEEAYQIKASYCLVLDNEVEKSVCSYYVNNDNFDKDTLYQGESSLALQDANNYIRELGGYLTGSGSCVGEEATSFVTKPYQKSGDQGKYTLVVNPNSDLNEIISKI